MCNDIEERDGTGMSGCIEEPEFGGSGHTEFKKNALAKNLKLFEVQPLSPGYLTEHQIEKML